MSYILVLLIPVLVFASISYSKFLRVLENEVAVNNYNNLLKSKNIIDAELSRIKNIVFQMEKSAEFKPFSYNDDLSKVFDIMNELQKYTIVNNFAETIVVHFKGDDYVYTNNSSCRLDLFGSRVYRYLNWLREDMMESLKNPGKSFYRPLEPVEINRGVIRNFVTYVASLPVNNPGKNASIIFMIPEKSIRRIFERNVRKYTTGFMIMDEENNIIFSNFDINQSDFEKYFDYSIHSGDGFQAIKLNGQDVMLSWTYSEAENWKYLSVMPLDVAMERVDAVKLGFMVGIIIMITSGGAAIIWGMYTNYKPIVRIMDYVVSKLNVNKNQANYFETLKQAIENLKQQNIDYQTEIAKNKRSIRQLLIQEALMGHAEGIDVYKKAEKCKDRFLSKKYYSVMIVNKKDGFDFFDERKGESIFDELKDKMESGEELYCIWGLLKGKLIIVMGYDDINYDLTFATQRLFEELKKIIGSTEIILAYGSPSMGTKKLHRSFFEAAMTDSFVSESGKIKGVYCFSEQMEEERYILDLHEKDFEEYKESIYKGDVDRIWSFLSRCIAVINDHKVPRFVARFICFDVIFNFLEVMQNLDPNFEYMKTEYPDILSIIQFESRSELSKTVKKVFYDISRHIESMHIEEDLRIKNEIIPYIKDNYMKPDFSIQNMADYFGMHTSNFSAYFKKATGRVASDYINSLKFEKTKQLLTETNMTISEIANLMNYSSASSFIRKFKGVNGLTPSDYRKLHQTLPRPED